MGDLQDINASIETENIEFNLASRWKRFVAFWIDAILLLVISLPLMFYVGAWENPTNNINVTVTEFIFYFAWSLISFLILNGYLLSKYGQTIGKRIVGIRIVDLQGKTLNLWYVFVLRYVLVWILSYMPYMGGTIMFIGYLLILTKERRCLHDYLAGTIVIK